MAALSHRSTNVPVNLYKKDALDGKMAAPKQTHREKQHPGTPPDIVPEPFNRHSYRLGSFLGRGGFAICHKAYTVNPNCQSAGEIVALKIVKSKMEQKKLQEKFRTELQIHSKMNHAHIVKFKKAFAFEDNTYIVLELCERGSLMDMVKYRKCLTLPEVRRFVIQMCGAIKYMHSRDIIHRDLKMGNIFLDDRMNVKIGDFGLAAILVGDKEATTIRRNTMCGTPNYIAPEILSKGKRGHDHKVDIWSLGIIIFAMLTGTPPFQSKQQDEIYRRIKERDYEWPASQRTRHITEEAKDLVAEILVEETLRPTADKIAMHDFFTTGLVPSSIPSSALQAEPLWPEPPSLGSSELKNYWNEQWKTLIKEVGLDLPSADELYPTLKKPRIESIYKELKHEIERGLQPVVPLPLDMIYENHPKALIRSESETLLKSTASRKALKDVASRNPEIQGQTSTQLVGSAVQEIERMPVTMRSRETRSRAAELREIGRPTRAQPPQRNVLPASNVNATSNQRPLLAEPQRRAIRPEPTSVPETKPDSKPDALPERKASGSVKHGVLSSDARRMGVVRSSSTRALRAKEEVAASTKATIGVKRTRSQADSGAAPSKVVNSTERIGSGTSGHRSEKGVSAPPKQSQVSKKDVSARAVFAYPDDPTDCFERTAPSLVLKDLQEFVQNLSSTLEGRKATAEEVERTVSLPLVDKCLDYTQKFGIGYILEDGAIGCLFFANRENPVTCIVVRDSASHVKRKDDETYPERHQVVPIKNGQPVEFFESCGSQGMRHVSVNCQEFHTNVKEGSVSRKLEAPRDRVDAERKRHISMWRNFSNYMLEAWPRAGARMHEKRQAGKREDIDGLDREAPAAFVKFYERFGDVQCLGFGDGSFQFNFPDHTKLLLSRDGVHCSFFHNVPQTCALLRNREPLPAALLDHRDWIHGPIAAFLHGYRSRKTFAFKQLGERNQFEKKLAFVLGVVRTWASLHGLGQRGGERFPVWDGLRAVGEDGSGQEKQIWVTVGAYPSDTIRHEEKGGQREREEGREEKRRRK